MDHHQMGLERAVKLKGINGMDAMELRTPLNDARP
jgi:hypothetical protein